ncbi:hypothetical protein FRC05_000816 [Tulasnella sp. 425]|nr:hypothetical protein FRC05_000816 [Tulasnella sp. 425]
MRFSNPPAASAPTVPLPTTYLVVGTKRIAILELTVSQLELDNARQVSNTNALLDEKLYPRMMAFAKERNDEKAARKLAEDRLAEVIASHAKMDVNASATGKRREQGLKPALLWRKNADLQAALLDLQARTGFLRVEELQKSLVRLGIVNPDDQQYPLAYPVCGDCIAPFLKSICATAKRGTSSGDGGERKREQGLARAGHQAFEVSHNEDGSSELVSEESARTLSKAPAPAQWFGEQVDPPQKNAKLISSRPISSASRSHVKIVEVGPRDGLQNEKSIIPTEVKVELIDKLGATGLQVIESGSFVSPKWVPQMAGTADVLLQIKKRSGVRYPVLVPNVKGLDTLVDLLERHPPPAGSSEPPLTDEIAVFVAASESFSKANINCSIGESIDRLVPVVRLARFKGLRVRGYVSTVITCPYEGAIAPEKVKDVAKALNQLGCYEISLGDTVGTGTPITVENMLDAVSGVVPVEKLAAHMHDTYGMGVVNSLIAVKAGIRTVDSSVAGLGGCPYSPGATGNVATEDIVHALNGAGYNTGVDLEGLAEIGGWISSQLGRPNSSRVGQALLARRKREAAARAKEGQAGGETIQAKL